MTKIVSNAKASVIVEMQEFIDDRYSDREHSNEDKALYTCAHDALNKIIVGDVAGAYISLCDMTVLHPDEAAAIREKLLELDLVP